MSLLFSSLIIKFIRTELELRVLDTCTQNDFNYLDTTIKYFWLKLNQLHMAADQCAYYSLLEAKDDNFRVVIWPLTHCQVQVTIDFLSCKQTYMMDLKRKSRHEIKEKISTHEADLSPKFSCCNSQRRTCYCIYLVLYLHVNVLNETH